MTTKSPYWENKWKVEEKRIRRSAGVEFYFVTNYLQFDKLF